MKLKKLKRQLQTKPVTLNLMTRLETRRITENHYIYRMIQLGKKWDRLHHKLTRGDTI